MRCPRCPVRDDLPCLGQKHRPVCDDVAAGMPGRSDQLIALAGGAKPAAPDFLVIRGHGNETGYGRMTRSLAVALERAGQPVRFDPILDWRHDLSPGLAERWIEPHHGRRVLQMSSPWGISKAGNVVFSMWESGGLPPESVATYNEAACLVVPCRWNRDVFLASGVTAPVRVVPLGVDPEVYRPARPEPAGFTVLSVGAVCGGGHRKGMEELMVAFVEAMGDRRDARLVIKIAPDNRLVTPPHPAIRIDNSKYTDAQMAALYQSCNVYATMTRGEGWGLPIHEAMASGRPVVGPVHTGIADYLTPDCAYVVDFDNEPAVGPYYDGHGDWYRPRHDAMVARLREAYFDRAGRRARGEAAARRAREFTWDRSARELLAVLREFGLVATPEHKPPGLITKAANLARSVVTHIGDGGRKAPDEVRAARKATCLDCPHLDGVRDRCSVCGCVAMDLKRSWASSECPDGRWGKA